MTWIAIGLSLTCVGLALKLMTMKSALTKASMLLSSERKKLQMMMERYESLKTKSELRIRNLKERNNELQEQSIKNAKPGDFTGILNGMLQNKDSEGSGSDE